MKITTTYKLLITLFFCCLGLDGFIKQVNCQPAPAPITDKKNTQETMESAVSEAYTNAFHLRSAIAIRKVSEIQEKISEAHKVISPTVKNLAMINKIYKLQKQIKEIVEKSIDRLNNPIDVDGDGLTDTDIIDKWKHIKTFSFILGETDGIFGLFKNIITGHSRENDLAMDEKGRIKLLTIIYKDLLQIRSALKSHIARIKRELYFYSKKKRELEAYKKLFSFE